jgi:hypothetical protein
MSNSSSVRQKDDGLAALARLEEALQLLDRFEAPDEIGAWVDLAINRLRGVLESELPERRTKPEEPID